MANVILMGDVFWIDSTQLLGVRLLGFNYDKTAILLQIERSAAIRFAQANDNSCRTFFAAVAGTLNSPPPVMISLRDQESDEERPRIPKKYKPYLKYAQEQMMAAWKQSMLVSDRHYYGYGRVRLYLTRLGLEEMYRQPRHLRLIYAAMLQAADNGSRRSVSKLNTPDEWTPPPETETGRRFKPYLQFSEAEMKSAVRKIGFPLGAIKISYGYFAITLNRNALFLSYKRSQYVKPAVAYLLKMFDELHAPTQNETQS